MSSKKRTSISWALTGKVTVRIDRSWDREGVPVLLAHCPKTSHFCRLQIIDSTEFRIAAIGRPESECLWAIVPGHFVLVSTFRLCLPLIRTLGVGKVLADGQANEPPGED